MILLKCHLNVLIIIVVGNLSLDLNGREKDYHTKRDKGLVIRGDGHKNAIFSLKDNIWKFYILYKKRREIGRSKIEENCFSRNTRIILSSVRRQFSNFLYFVEWKDCYKSLSKIELFWEIILDFTRVFFCFDVLK